MTTETTLQSAGQYILSYLGVCDSLSKEQAYLDGVSKSALLPESERAMAAVVAASIGLKLLQMSATHELFMQRLQDGVRPPTEAQISEAVRLSTALAVDIHKAATAAAIMDVALKFVNDWTTVVTA